MHTTVQIIITKHDKPKLADSTITAESTLAYGFGKPIGIYCFEWEAVLNALDMEAIGKYQDKLADTLLDEVSYD